MSVLLNEEAAKYGDASLECQMRMIRTLAPADLGIGNAALVTGVDFTGALTALAEMTHVGSALMKLKMLQQSVQAMHDATSAGGNVVQGADDVLPLFVYLLARSEVLYPEAEALYMELLLDESLLLGEGGYYLTTFSGAAMAIRQWRATLQPVTGNAPAPPPQGGLGQRRPTQRKAEVGLGQASGASEA